MIICNLAVLLAERHLKITKVSQDTKISRTTLTALANNYGSGIQFDTINTLCLYLKTTPEQLILFAPVNIENINVTMEGIGKDVLSADVTMSIDISGKKRLCSIQGSVYLECDDDEIYDIQIILELWDEEANADDEDMKEENIFIKKAFGMLNRTFIEHIAGKIRGEIFTELENSHFYFEDQAINKTHISDHLSMSFNWPFDDWGGN